MRSAQRHTVYLPVTHAVAAGDAGRATALGYDYDRIAWAEVLAELRAAALMRQVDAEHARVLYCVLSDDLLDTDEQWQAVFDRVVDDWHGRRELGGEVQLRVFFVGLTPAALLPMHLRDSLARVVGARSELRTLSLACHLAAFAGAGDGDKRDQTWDVVSPKQLEWLKSLAAASSGPSLIAGMDAAWRWARVRQELCNHFGCCVLLRYTPCDILGNASKARAAGGASGASTQRAGAGEGRASQALTTKGAASAKATARADALRKGSDGAGALTTVIDSEARWRAAVREVEDDWNTYRDLGGRYGDARRVVLMMPYLQPCSLDDAISTLIRLIKAVRARPSCFGRPVLPGGRYACRAGDGCFDMIEQNEEGRTQGGRMAGYDRTE